jgi:hypothetical protein
MEGSAVLVGIGEAVTVLVGSTVLVEWMDAVGTSVTVWAVVRCGGRAGKEVGLLHEVRIKAKRRTFFDLIFSQIIQLVHKLIDLPISGLDLARQLFLLLECVRCAIVDQL